MLPKMVQLLTSKLVIPYMLMMLYLVWSRQLFQGQHAFTIGGCINTGNSKQKQD